MFAERVPGVSVPVSAETWMPNGGRHVAFGISEEVELIWTEEQELLCARIHLPNRVCCVSVVVSQPFPWSFVYFSRLVAESRSILFRVR